MLWNTIASPARVPILSNKDERIAPFAKFVTMHKLVFFRADKRPFKTKDPISTAGEFMGKHPEKGKRAELALANSKPDGKPNRSDCLMLFEDEVCARNHWSKMTGGRLYRIEVDEADILHRGDMKLIDTIGERLWQSSTADVSEDTTRYWGGEETGGCMETIAKKGVVLEELGDEKSRQKWFKKLIGL